MMKKWFALVCLQFVAVCASAQAVDYAYSDSIKITSLLADCTRNATTNELVSYFGHRLCGVPYVAKTLDKQTDERLVVNLHELDCTTFTETTFALALCAKLGKTSFDDYCHYLRLLRYHEGNVAYHTRQHYFTTWIDDAIAQGLVAEPTYPTTLCPQTKRLDIGFMTAHKNLYPQLLNNQALVDSIAKTEKALTGRTFRFIPKSQLRKYDTLRKCVKDGDIIVIITNKQGLDTSHIGIASWHKDGTLHLLNASQIHKKVVDEPMTLYDYMQRHPSQTGIRVLNVL